MHAAQQAKWTIRWIATSTLVVALVGSNTACFFKKKQPPVPHTTNPPTLVIPPPQPQPQPEPQPTLPPVEQTPPPAPPDTTEKPKPKKKPHITHKTTPKPAPPPPQTPPTPPATEQQQGTKTDAMVISPGIPASEADSQKRATEQLLQTAEGNLRKLNRQLSDREDEMVRQVRNYITQSRLATQDGDYERARNLAVKANLLSGELVK